MKNCSNCGGMNEDGARFCAICGNTLGATPSVSPVPPMQPNSSVYSNVRRDMPVNGIRPSVGGRFVDGNEHVVATLENGVMMNIISGEGFRKEDAILTNKRLYYKHKDGIVTITECEEMVDVKDITGTKITSFEPYGILIISGLLFIAGLIANSIIGSGLPILFGFLLAMIGIIVFVSLKKKFLKIEYAGGAIHFSVKKYGMQNIQSFPQDTFLPPS